ncbi:alpha/beta hydrolase [Aquabacterium sp. OR-4]|uniref:alpha/beta hydrolase n=1 Tax=Aquabacterium sp. OR-4 TaxID=2978127 RepID=UPI0028C9DAD7|nr:alpha/beta hydrolase [Aquabacterium sp. OR-4]MDT7833682.1 alpha/beta hydrolase [Aquabacterium sp. OR-4]
MRRPAVARRALAAGLAALLAALLPAAAAPGAAGSAAALARVTHPATRPATTPATTPSGLAPCRLKHLSQAAQCGVLLRPLDPARPGGPVIEIHYAVLPAQARHKAADPVFFFAGGPGQSAIDAAAHFAGQHARLNQRRDLVLVDLRGTGRSAPLICPDDRADAPPRPLAEQFDPQARLARLAACRVALQALPHGDLRQFTTTLAVADVEAVRQALGAPRVNAIGVSYGTRVVLEWLRQQPQALRRVVLDGVAPPDLRLAEAAARDNQQALEALLADCARDAACARRHPALRQQLQALAAGLPQQASLPHPLSGQAEPLRIDRDALAALLRAPLYAPALAAGLPAAIEAAAQGNWAPLAGLGMALGGGGGMVLASGLHHAVVCAEDLGAHAPAPPPEEQAATRQAGNLFGGVLQQHYQRSCADWPRGAVPADFYRVVRSPVPVWLLSGGADPVTPPRHAERTARALGPQARHIVLGQAGHGVATQPCVRNALQRFITLADDAAALGTDREALAACNQGLPRPPAFTPPGSPAPAPQERR